MSELKHNIQQCVSDIHEWYDQNKLVIIKSKSSVMLATTIDNEFCTFMTITWMSILETTSLCKAIVLIILV